MSQVILCSPLTLTGPIRRTLRDYGWRLGGAEMFADLKGRGCHLDVSQLLHPERFSRLLLAVTLR